MIPMQKSYSRRVDCANLFGGVKNNNTRYIVGYGNALIRRPAGESFSWTMLPASELKLAASATAGKFSSAARLTLNNE